MASVDLRLGDCLGVMRGMPENSVDSVITDCPYGLSFMGKDWDHGVPGVPFWAECLRVAKPGTILLAFGGTRTWHRLAVAIEDAGWEIRDCLMWVYGSGFPKSHDISKAIDKAAGVNGQWLERKGETARTRGTTAIIGQAVAGPSMQYTPSTPTAQQWDGWGTALKPAFEPIIMAQAPLSGTYAQNALQHGVAGLWIDGCRIEANGERPLRGNHSDRPADTATGYDMGSRYAIGATSLGRWPANLLLNEEAAEMLDRQVNEVSRFFYVAKASRAERNAGLEGMPERATAAYGDETAEGAAMRGRQPRHAGTTANHHPTVKPLTLLRYLCRLTRTPTGGTVLDPFAGSGTTGVAAILEGRDFVGIELEPEYMEIAKKRIEHARRQMALPLLEAAD